MEGFNQLVQFIFSSFWIWCGTVIIIYAIGESVGNCIALLVRRTVTIKKDEVDLTQG